MRYVTDLSKLIHFGITPNQFLLLRLISDRAEEELLKYKEACGPFTTEEVKGLVKKELLIDQNAENEYLFGNYKLTKEAQKLLEIKEIDSFTEQLLLVFPTKTPSGRRLKVGLKKEIEALYLKCHKNKQEEHEKIVGLLKKEIEIRKINNSLEYMQSVKVWLRQKTYLQYEDELENTENIELNGSELL